MNAGETHETIRAESGMRYHLPPYPYAYPFTVVFWGRPRRSGHHQSRDIRDHLTATQVAFPCAARWAGGR